MNLKQQYADTLPELVSLCLPTPVTQPRWIYFNDELARQIGLSRDNDSLQALAGNAVFPDSQPVAQAYSGHQFGQFNPNLGDGRAHLLGEVQVSNQTVDLALKGSGRTPYSRGGDGRAALGPMLREVLISEHLHALGIASTRSLAVVGTGESVNRQFGPESGAILARLASSHIRVGTFEHCAARGQIDTLKALFEYTCQRHYPDLKDPMDLLRQVCGRQAELIAQWMSVGFIHGVMNTDNMTLSGESIDFGPCAFMDGYNPAQVYSSIDQQGRYAYQNQPGIGQWNLTRLAECLITLYPNDERDERVEQAKSLLAEYEMDYQSAYHERMRQKLGLTELPSAMLADWLALLSEQQVDWTLAHAMLFEPNDWIELFAQPEQAQQWRESWLALNPNPKMASQHNPWVSARNHLVDHALRMAEDGELEPFNQLLDRLKAPFDKPDSEDWIWPASTGFAARFRTFCGT